MVYTVLDHVDIEEDQWMAIHKLNRSGQLKYIHRLLMEVAAYTNCEEQVYNCLFDLDKRSKYSFDRYFMSKGT